MNSLIDHVKDNWQVLKRAPFVFVVLFLLAFALAWWIEDLRYEDTVQSLRDRLSAKEDLLDEYRQRLHITELTGTAYSILTNKELREKALAAVKNLRTLISQNGEAHDKLSSEERAAMRSAKTENEKQEIWDNSIIWLTRLSQELHSDYESEFKVELILLRDEILSRLPKSSKDGRGHNDYERPTNPIGMGFVADDLERLARLLPD